MPPRGWGQESAEGHREGPGATWVREAGKGPPWSAGPLPGPILSAEKRTRDADSSANITQTESVTVHVEFRENLNPGSDGFIHLVCVLSICSVTEQGR